MSQKGNFTARDPREDLLPWVRIEQFAGHELARPIVLVNGAFDLPHAGHFKLLWHARQHGKTVVLALDSDRKVKEAKGEERPLLSWIERATTLSYCGLADFAVEIDSDEEFLTLVELLEPDLRVKGAEYRGRKGRIDHVRTMFVRSGGLRTSAIVERIVKRYDPR